MLAMSLLDEYPKMKYDVYLSFMGEDTGKNFTDHLYEALTRVSIRTYKGEGNQLLEKGNSIPIKYQNTIEESRVSVVIFSRNYGNSIWCLEELVKILDCKKTRGQLVLPLFYNVSPSDVRKRTGSFGEASKVLLTYVPGQTIRIVGRWTNALTEVANLAGWDLHTDANGYEAKLIKKVVSEIEVLMANEKMMSLDEEEAKLEEEEEANQEKMMDLQKQLKEINIRADILASRRDNLIIRRKSLEGTRKQFSSDQLRLSGSKKISSKDIRVKNFIDTYITPNTSE